MGICRTPFTSDNPVVTLRFQRLEKRSEPQTRAESKTRIIEQINGCLRSGHYSRALDLLRGAVVESPGDADLAELEKLAKDGVARKADADRLITESQGLFAQRKSAEAIQLLRKAYELDKTNSLARAILANALVEHAQSMAETDWLEAETLANQALALNPAHPTAQSTRDLILDRKKVSSVEDWVSQARKRQSAGDLFAALAWVAEGLAIHPDDPKLLQIQESIQRDQGARRRQARRVDLEDLRHVELEIDSVTEMAAKQALAGRIQTMAAKYWTDGEILSIANRLLHRLGMAPQERSTSLAHSKGATVIFHVPPPVPSRPAGSPAPTSVGLRKQVPARLAPPDKIPSETITTREAPAPVVPKNKVSSTPSDAEHSPPQVAPTSVAPSAPAEKVESARPRPKQPTRSKSATLILVSAATVLVCGTIFFFARKHQAAPPVKTPVAVPGVSSPAVSTPTVSVPAAPGPIVSTSAPTNPPPTQPADSSARVAAENVPSDNQPAPEISPAVGTLIVVAGQDDARVFLNGKFQAQVTRGGQLRLPNLAPKDYVVQVSKSGFQDPPEQKIRIRKGQEARVVFNLQPQPLLASLIVQGGTPGATVFVDKTPAGTIQPDGTFSIPTVPPGDHTLELRKDRFVTRQLKKHFVAGGSVTLTAADAGLDSAPGELKVIFTPADANVAIAKGNFLKLISSGIPLNLAPGSYTLTARTAERFTRAATLEISDGELKTLNLSLAPSGMSKWEEAGAWKQEGDTFVRKGGDFVLYGVAPVSGTFVFSAMAGKGHLLQWVLNYTDSRNYVLFQLDENNFYRTVIRNGAKTDAIIVPHKTDKKSLRTLQIRVSAVDLVHQIKDGDSWTVLDHWTQPGTNLSSGKFGFYIPGNEQVTISSFAHYADLNVR